MAAPRKKPVVKKAPVKKKPSFLRKDTPRPARDVKPGDLRSQTLTNDNKPRPAKDLNKGGLRAQYLKGANAGGGSAVARGLIKKIPVVGAALGFIADAAPAGEGSTKDKYSTLKKKYSSAIGPTKPKTRSEIPANERAPGRGPGVYGDIARERTVKYNPGDYAKYRSGQGTTSVRPTTTRPKPTNTKVAPSTYTGYGTWNAPKKKKKPSDAFTLGSGAQTTGNKPFSGTAPNPPSRPNQAAPAASVKKVGRLSRTEREGLSTDRMQRKPKGNLLGFLKKRK
jgi:hypothetical protein